MQKENKNRYAVIDLGSNSFHLWILEYSDGRIHTINRIKDKTRLGRSIDSNLTQKSMDRGWQCLRYFKQFLDEIPVQNIIIAATAAIRAAQNQNIFLSEANKILNLKIQVISGLKEASLIYDGATRTTDGPSKKLVIDIGGASTEIIMGDKAKIIKMNSFKLGCVSFIEKYFKNRRLNEENFNLAIAKTKETLKEASLDFNDWDLCIGASGTIQTLFEIKKKKSNTNYLTKQDLYKIKNQLINCESMEYIDLEGLTPEKANVFPSGLAILIGIFEILSINSLYKAGGALREGLLNQLIPLPGKNILTNNLRVLRNTYQLKNNYQIILDFFDKIQFLTLVHSQEDKDIFNKVILALAYLNQIGLSINFKNQYSHAAYIIQNIEIIGFDEKEKNFIAHVLRNLDLNKEEFSSDLIFNSNITDTFIKTLRIAITLQDVNEKLYNLIAHEKNLITLELSKNFSKKYAFTYNQLINQLKDLNNSQIKFNISLQKITGA